jgi:hypothetical protein
MIDHCYAVSGEINPLFFISSILSLNLCPLIPIVREIQGRRMSFLTPTPSNYEVTRGTHTPNGM